MSKAFEEDALINKILSSLSPDFFYFNYAWDSTSETEKTLLNLSERLIKEEEKLKHAAQNPIDVTKAFYSRSTPPRQHSLPNSGSHLCTGQKCLHSSHSLITRPPTPKPPIFANANGSPLTLEQRQIRQKHFDDLKKTTVCHACGTTGHWKGECPNITKEEGQSYRKKPPRSFSSGSSATRTLTASAPAEVETSVAFMATLFDLTPDIWYVDCAASNHLTGHREWFTTFQELLANHWPIKGISSTLVYAAGIGDIAIDRLLDNEWRPGYLELVLYVPGLDNNLFSVTRAALKDIETTCTSTGCIMLCVGVPVLEARLHGSMYKLSIRVIPPCSLTQALVAASFRSGTLAEECQSIQVWHNRLYHLNYTSIRRLATSDTINGIRLQHDSSAPDLFSEGCYKGKQHRTPFLVNSPRIRAVQPGALLHADLLGPIDPPSVGGALYCLLLKDDATGCRIAICIPKKSDALSCIQQTVR
jgi:hypothetical protein